MRTATLKGLTLVWLLIAFGLMGCGGGDPKSQVVGTWKFDFASLKIPGVTEEMKNSPQMAEGKKAFDNAKVEFKSDGTFALIDPAGKAETGKWSLNERSLTMTPDKPDNSPQPAMTLSEDGKKIHFSASQGGRTMEVDLVKQ